MKKKCYYFDYREVYDIFVFGLTFYTVELGCMLHERFISFGVESLVIGLKGFFFYRSIS